MKSTLDNYMNELDAFLTEASTVKFNNKETLRGQGFDRKVKEDGAESGSELGGEFSFTPEAKPKQESPQQEVSPDDNQGQVQAGENQEATKKPNNNDVKAEGEPAPETTPETAPEPQQPNANNGLKKKYMKMLKVVTTIQKEVNQLEKASGKTIDELAEIASQSSQQSSEQQQ